MTDFTYKLVHNEPVSRIIEASFYLTKQEADDVRSKKTTKVFVSGRKYELPYEVWNVKEGINVLTLTEIS